MLSFRSELENINNPVVENDIIDLADKIAKFKNLQIDVITCRIKYLDSK